MATTKRIDDDHMGAWASLLQVHSVLVGTLERELIEARGMPLAWYEVLLHLTRAPEGAMRMQDLSEAVLLSKSGVTRLVDRMEEAKLVTRQACALDRRGTYATITQAGREAFRRASPAHLRSLEEHFGRHLSAEEGMQLRALLGKVLEGNRQGEPGCVGDGALTAAL